MICLIYVWYDIFVCNIVAGNNKIYLNHALQLPVILLREVDPGDLDLLG